MAVLGVAIDSERYEALHHAVAIARMVNKKKNRNIIGVSISIAMRSAAVVEMVPID